MNKSFKGRLVLSKEISDSWYSRGYFPHFDSETSTQHVCFHLFDSLPQSLLSQWREEFGRLRAGGRLQEYELQREYRKRIHDSLDAGYGSCFLRDDRCAEIVEDSLLHFDGQRYRLHAWCIMPNHVHTLFTPGMGFKMSAIVHSWKSFTAHECNKILGRSGKFWEREPFDRYIRNERHFRNAARYVEKIQLEQVFVPDPKTGDGAVRGGWLTISTPEACVPISTPEACVPRRCVLGRESLN